MSIRKGTYTVKAVAGQAEICLKGGIWDWDVQRFELAVDALLADGITTGTVFIDSFGGDAFAAQRIGNIIDKFPGKLNCEIGVLAASNASYIAAKCKRVSIASNGQIMIHKPSLVEGGNVDEIQAKLKMLRNITKDYAKVYAAKMGITEGDIARLWAEDYWMNAEEAQSQGFVDEILEPVEVADADVVAELRSAGRWQEPVVTAQHNNDTNPKNNDMKNSLVLAALDLPENSDDAAVLKAVQKLVTANAELTSKVTSLENEAKKQKEDQVKALVDAALKENKITEAERDRYTKLATADFENTAAVLADKKPHVTASSIINNQRGQSADPYATWDYDKLQKEKPEVLAQIKKDDPERFKKLREEYLRG